MDRDDSEYGAKARAFPVRYMLLVAAILFAAAITVGLILKIDQSGRFRDRALQQERHSYDVLLLTTAVSGSMSSAEAALGRYAIGADRAMGTRYYDDWVLAGAQIDRLAALVARNPVEAPLVARLRTLYDARAEELNVPAVQASRRQGWPALNSFNAVGHSRRIAEINRTLDAISDHERDRLEHRYNQSDMAATEAADLVWHLSLAGVLLILAAAALGWAVLEVMSGQRRAQADADAAGDRAAWLEAAVAERTQELSTANAHLQSEMITRANAEAQLRQVQKMEAVGQLTGGIAHDFNNMLAVVVGGLDLAKRRLAQEREEVERQIDNALDGANRAAALTRRLLGFARAEPLLPEAADPGTLIAGMSDLIDRTLGERVQVEIRIAEDCWPVWVDPMQFENAILNLAVNARDAMDGAGTLAIAVDNIVLGADAYAGLPAGDYARVLVIDTGAGMTPDVLERVFEPFFTTKPVGKGTGLGLSQIFGFVHQSGGEVAIRSEPGEGTAVTIYLPRADAVARPARTPAVPIPIRAPEPITPPKAETGEPVLVVEDDARVRAATVGALEELGYHPIACADAVEALATLSVRADLKLIVTDVVMPGMTGPELVAQVRARHPGIGVLFVTGYAGEAGSSAGGGGGLEGQAVLRKPFTIAALERAMAETVARAASAPHPAQEGGAAA